ncbi:hypothetical protein AB0C77_35770 [Streptomyces sp. NPDC048629]|uniref:hypothetical protein n=1 Tax=Streptomyces sp. NPDC048629 TaxID=3154824 RepID=UPI003432B1DA
MHGDVLPGAAMAGAGVPAALGNQLAGAGLPAEEPARVEAVRLGPEVRVAVVAGYVEKHQRALGDVV